MPLVKDCKKKCTTAQLTLNGSPVYFALFDAGNHVAIRLEDEHGQIIPAGWVCAIRPGVGLVTYSGVNYIVKDFLRLDEDGNMRVLSDYDYEDEMAEEEYLEEERDDY